MIKQILLLIFRGLIINGCVLSPQYPIIATNSEIFSNTAYVPSASHNFLTNITGESINSVGECARECLQNRQCATATFYPATQTCSLYQERCGLGTRIDGVNQTASTICVNNRNPAVIYCTTGGHDVILQENQFIYSANQLFAFGIKTPNWGIFHAGAYGSIVSSFWQPAGNIPPGYIIALQNDGNVVLYTQSGSVALALGGQYCGSGPPYTFYVSDTGKLSWIDGKNQLALQTP